jgi:hypothetical protein
LDLRQQRRVELVGWIGLESQAVLKRFVVVLQLPQKLSLRELENE